MTRSHTAAPTRALPRRLVCTLSAAAAFAPLAGCAVGPPSAAGGSATIRQVPASAVINVPAATPDQVAPDAPIRVETGDGELTNVSVSRDHDGADIAGAEIENPAGETTAWEMTATLDADESYTVAADAEDSAGQTTSAEFSVRTAPTGTGEDTL